MQLITSLERGTRGFFAAALLLSLASPGAKASPLGAPEPIKPAPASAQSTSDTGTDSSSDSDTTSKKTPPPTSASLPPGRSADIPSTITVTVATRDPQPVDTTATSTTVLTNDELKNQNYSRAADALLSVPGLAVVTSGTPGQLTSVFTRGASSDETLLTIDGRRQAPDFSNFYDFTNLTLDNVDQIEVMRTPGSALQGADAIGGVINIATLSGRGVTTPESSVAFEGGSFDTFREFAQSLGAVNDFDYAVAFSRQDSHYPRPDSGYNNTVYRGNFGYTITPKIYFDLQTSYTTSVTGDPSIISFPDPTAWLLRETWNISPRISAQVTDFYTTTLYYNRTQMREVGYDLFNDTHNRSQIDTDSIDWQNDVQIARNWKITAGIQGDNYVFTDFDNVGGLEDIDGHTDNIGGYVQSQWQPLAGLNVINSVRYDSYSQFGGAFSWRQAVSYQMPVTATVVHASIASAYQTPSVDQLYSPAFSALGWVIRT